MDTVSISFANQAILINAGLVDQMYISLQRSKFSKTQKVNSPEVSSFFKIFIAV